MSLKVRSYFGIPFSVQGEIRRREHKFESLLREGRRGFVILRLAEGEPRRRRHEKKSRFVKNRPISIQKKWVFVILRLFRLILRWELHD
jgi:hypothetical protein